MRLLGTYAAFSTDSARRATYCVHVSTALCVSDLCARSDLCLERTALRVSDLLRMIKYGFACKATYALEAAYAYKLRIFCVSD